MSTTVDTIQFGIAHHQAGRLDLAEEAYRQVLAAEPNHAGAMHLLGLVALHRGDLAQAKDWISAAIQQDPMQATFHANLAEVHRAYGDLAAAESCYRYALRIKPDLAEAHNNLGTILQAAKRSPEAIASYRAALALRPDYVDAHNNLGTIWQEREQWDQAMASYRRAVEIAPGYAKGHFNMGMIAEHQGHVELAHAAFKQAIKLDERYARPRFALATMHRLAGRHNEAIEEYGRALQLEPNNVEGLIGLGTSYHLTKQFALARDCYQRAMELEPGSLTAQYNLGAVLQGLGQYDESMRLYRAVLAVDPNHLETLTAIGGLHVFHTEYDQAIGFLDHAIQIAPHDALAHFHRGLALLSTGQLVEGFKEYEFYERNPLNTPRKLPEPRWEGEPLAGRTLLVHTMQGRGDIMHFIRYLPLLADRGGRVKCEVAKPMIPLLEESGFADLVPQIDPHSSCDLQVPLSGLPRLCGTTLETVPADIPYLFANPARVQKWRALLEEVQGFRIGIHWQGNPEFSSDRHRSMKLECFEPLARIAGVRLISLQKGFGSEQIEQVADRFEVVQFPELDDEGGAFMDSAAVIKLLDLVVTSDSAIAHLAGAMGMPVWLALSVHSEWRWLRQREDSPWYPTMRLFRQTQSDQWAHVFQRIAVDVQKLVASRPSRNS